MASACSVWEEEQEEEEHKAKRRRGGGGASWDTEEPGGPERRGPWGCEETETPRDLLETRHGAHSYYVPFQGGSVLLCRAFILLRGWPGLGGERNPSGQQQTPCLLLSPFPTSPPGGTSHFLLPSPQSAEWQMAVILGHQCLLFRLCSCMKPQ